MHKHGEPANRALCEGFWQGQSKITLRGSARTIAKQRLVHSSGDKRPSDSELVIPAIDAHEKTLGCTPRLVAGDAAFYSARNEAAAHERGVKRVCIPNRSTKSAERKREQKKRWFKQGQKWRTGCEGRISVLKRRHGLRRCIYRGDAGMKRWVGLGVIADNLHHIGKVLAERKN